MVTTEFVLAEFLNFYASCGPTLRGAAAELAARTLEDPRVDVVAPHPSLFSDGLALYGSRPDKRYSLTDCISMIVMRQRRIAEALTHDRHFTQEGFVALLREET